MFASCTLFSDNSQPLYDITVDNDSVGALYWLRRTLRVARGCISSAASDRIFNKKKILNVTMNLWIIYIVTLITSWIQ